VTVSEPNVTNTESQRGVIRRVSFPEPQQLQKEGANLFSVGNSGGAQPDTRSRLVQGSIEKSNVDGVVEITRLIEISRAYGQMATLLQQQSDLHKNAIHDLSSVPA
jgi:flagellar basal body rod protein FlgG